LFSSPPEQKPKNQDQEEKPSNAASHHGTTIIKTASASKKKQQDQNDQNHVHGVRSYQTHRLDAIPSPLLSAPNDNVLFVPSRNVLLTAVRLGRCNKDNY